MNAYLPRTWELLATSLRRLEDMALLEPELRAAADGLANVLDQVE